MRWESVSCRSIVICGWICFIVVIHIHYYISAVAKCIVWEPLRSIFKEPVRLKRIVGGKNPVILEDSGKGILQHPFCRFLIKWPVPVDLHCEGFWGRLKIFEVGLGYVGVVFWDIAYLALYISWNNAVEKYVQRYADNEHYGCDYSSDFQRYLEHEAFSVFDHIHIRFLSLWITGVL